MSATGFNADEVFDMGVQVEKNGETFYRAAADTAAESNAVELFSQLADMERSHIAIFEGLKKELAVEDSEQEGFYFDPNGQAAAYLKAMANRHVFLNDADPAVIFSNKTLEQILDIAIDFERDSIAFFIGIRDIVPERFGKSKIDNLIDEEKSHVVMLSNRKEQLTD